MLMFLPAAAAAVAACDVRLVAPQVAVQVKDDGIVLAGEAAADSLAGGETVLTIRNDSSAERQIVLARLGDSADIPSGLLEAEMAKDDSRIVDITEVLAPPGPPGDDGEPQVATARFHIYLAPGEWHALFDRLGGLDDGLVVRFVPGTEPREVQEQAPEWP